MAKKPRIVVIEDEPDIGRLWDDMAAEGRLYGVMHEGGWADVGRPDAIALAENLLAAADV